MPTGDKLTGDFYVETTLQIERRVAKPSGAADYYWETLDRSVWINPEPIMGALSAPLSYIAGQLQPSVMVKVTFRYRNDVILGCRFVDVDSKKGWLLKTDPKDIKYRHFRMECICQETVVDTIENKRVVTNVSASVT